MAKKVTKIKTVDIPVIAIWPRERHVAELEKLLVEVTETVSHIETVLDQS